MYFFRIISVDERDPRFLPETIPGGESSFWQMSMRDFKPELTRKHSVRKGNVTTLGLTYKVITIYYHVQLPKCQMCLGSHSEIALGFIS